MVTTHASLEANIITVLKNGALKMDYFGSIRREIRPLLPVNPSRILDIGAGVGATLSWLKTIYPDVETTGVEINKELSDQLAKNADIAVIGDIDGCLERLRSYDLILFLDVLEHLSDPLETLKKLIDVLEPGGSVIVSVPNIAHLSVSVPLLLQRRFTYQDAGILDRTHLKFFVEDTAIKLLNEANIIVTAGLISGLQGPKAKILNCITCGLLRHHLSKQYIMAGKVANSSLVQNKIRWMIAE